MSSDAPKATRTPCQRCGEIHNRSYLKNFRHEEICSDCLTIAKINPADREYLRVLANKYGLRLHDMPTHMIAANQLNMRIDDYLTSLPKTHAEFTDYWKGKHPTLAGVPLL